MTEQILLTPMDPPRKKFWKSWKWIGLAVYIAALAIGRYLPGPVVAAAYIYGFAVIANLVFFGFRYLREKLFWRVRNRLIGAFIFVGALPLLILLGLIALTGYIMLAQLGGQYLSNALEEYQHLVSEIDIELAAHISPRDATKAFRDEAPSILASHSNRLPHLAARLSCRNSTGALLVVAKYDPNAVLRDVSPYPGDKWLGTDQSFEGILKDGKNLLFASLRPIPGAAGCYLETAAPLDKFVEERLLQEKSLYATFDTENEANVTIAQNEVRVRLNDSDSKSKPAQQGVEHDLNTQEDNLKSDTRKMVWGVLPVKGKEYESGKNTLVALAAFRVPRNILFNAYMGLSDEQSQIVLKVIYVMAGIFVFVVLVSLFIGFTISRHITRSVHDVYQGILALQKSDLKHRIPVRRSDQLGLLAHSFNQMSGSISRLLEEVVEKERLEKELEIAREVQTTLFPKQLPHPPGMTIFGGCKPARIVSGDYYDFVVEDEAHLDIVVGDISGKGISAALLMANLQAAMRSQLHSSKQNDPAAIGQSLASVMTQLNQQIYLNSPPEKYATLFLSRYDANSRRLWYCNAGHLPPIVLSARGTQTLEPTGTVVGLLPRATYEAKSIELIPGTLLAIFTDGITEALNRSDEEFGENRLMTALQQSGTQAPEGIWRYVMSRIDEWQTDLPQYDDITLIVAKSG
jgi:sigma-B regulation protein RsbU (phosphoserine phosphatase)